MPIRLNLLAESQAAEESRRRDPLKRGLVIAGVMVGAMLIWCASLWVISFSEQRALASLQKDIEAHSQEFSKVQESKTQLAETRQKIAALQQLAANRFLNGNVMNALQKATVENVQLIRLSAKQDYVFAAETKAVTNGTSVTPPKPPSVTEKIGLVLEAKDFNRTGDALQSFKQLVASQPYFQKALAKPSDVRLKDVGSPQTGPDGRSFVQFVLECQFPDKTR
jgi:hypothetical protein